MYVLNESFVLKFHFSPSMDHRDSGHSQQILKCSASTSSKHTFYTFFYKPPLCHSFKKTIFCSSLFFVFLIPRFVALWLLTYSSDQPSPHSLSPCVHQAFRMRGRETPKHESLKDVKRKIDHCRCTCKNNSVQWREREMGTEEEGDGSISLLSSS